MRALILSIMLLFTSVAHADEYRYLEFKLSKNTGDNGWVGDYPASVELGYYKDFSDKVYGKIYYKHESNIDKGPPRNNDFESWMEEVGIGIGVKF